MRRTGGTLDALFNNGAYAQAGAVEDLPVAALREQFEANFFGWHDLTRRVVPVMRGQGHGRIVHCSSILGLVPVRFRGAYSASKHALEGLMLCSGRNWRVRGIHVSLIEPGPVKSKIATNGLAWFQKNIDHENRSIAMPIVPQLARLEAADRSHAPNQARGRAGGIAPRASFPAAPTALCGDLAGTDRRSPEARPARIPAIQGAGERPEPAEAAGKPMSTVFNILAVLVMIAVVIVLIRGLVNMLRGGSGNDLQQADAGAGDAAVRCRVLLLLSVYGYRR